MSAFQKRTLIERGPTRRSFLFQLIADLVETRVGTAIVKFGARRAARTDGADTSSPSFDHHATTEEHDMRQLGKWRNRNLALGTLMVTGSGAKALVGSRLAQRSPLAPP